LSKLQPLCPFSRKPCRECGIFRGRHLSLCHYPQYQSQQWNPEASITGSQPVEKPISPTNNTRFEFPELPENPAWLVNPEDSTERRDG